MSRNQADMVLRLVAKDEGVRAALEGAGKAGKKALRDIDRAAKGAKPGLKAVDNVMGDVKRSADDMLGRLGPVGSALKGIGPVGIVAGAGFAATVLGLQQMSAAGEQFIMTAAEMGRTAEQLELDPEQFQALRLEMERLGVATNSTDAAFATAQKTLSEATLGTGEFYSAVRQINPELVEQVRLATTTSQRIDLIRDAYRNAGTEAERNTILVRTFGDGNIAAGREILMMKGSIEDTTAAYKAQGLIISGDLLPKYEQMAQDITANSQKAEAAALRLTARLSDLGLSGSQLKARASEFLVGLFPPEGLDDEIITLTQKVNRLNEAAEGFGGDSVFLGNFTARAQAAQGELDALIKKRERLAAADAAVGAQFGLGGSQSVLDPTPAADPATPRGPTEAERTAAQNELNAARQRAAQVLATLGNISGLVAQKERELNDLVARGTLDRADADAALKKYTDTVRAQTDAGRAQVVIEQRAAEVGLSLMTQTEQMQAKLNARALELKAAQDAGALSNDQVRAALAAYRDELLGVDDAKRQLNSALLDTLDPMARYNQELAELNRLQELGKLSDGDFAKILANRKKALTDELERDSFGETLDAAETRIREAAMGAEAVIQAKIDAEKAIIEALGDRLSDDEAATYLEKYEKGLREASAAGREFEGVNSLIQDALRGNIKSFEDFGEAALSILGDVISKALEGSDALGGIFGSGGFGDAIGSVLAGVFHDGTHSPSRPKRTRQLGAGSRLGRDETIAVVRRQERIFSESDNRDLIRAIRSPVEARIDMPPAAPMPVIDMSALFASAPAGPSAPQVHVEIINASGEPVKREESTDAQGNRQLRIMIGNMVNQQIDGYFSGPRGDRRLKDRYGLLPTTTGRRNS